MKYITILETCNHDCKNVGTITIDDNDNVEVKFKEAIESHFDGTLKSYKFVDIGVTNLGDCINDVPVNISVAIDTGALVVNYDIELSETWLY